METSVFSIFCFYLSENKKKQNINCKNSKRKNAFFALDLRQRQNDENVSADGMLERDAITSESFMFSFSSGEWMKCGIFFSWWLFCYCLWRGCCCLCDACTRNHLSVFVVVVVCVCSSHSSHNLNKHVKQLVFFPVFSIVHVVSDFYFSLSLSFWYRLHF